MSLRDLNWTDLGRIASVSADLFEGRDGEPLSVLLEQISEEIRKEPSPPPPPAGFVGFSNPPPPKAFESGARRIVRRVRDALVARYGESYADDLWSRLRKR